MTNALKEKIDRHVEFFSNPAPGQILGSISTWTFPLTYAELGLEKMHPNDYWDWENKPEEQVDQYIRFLRAWSRAVGDLDNDYIPSHSVGGGTGLYGAYLGNSDVTFSPDTSWSKEALEDWSQLEGLKAGEDNRWTHTIKRIVKRGAELCDGSYIPSTMPHFAPSDLANAMRGNSLFLDFFDFPEKVRQLLDLCAESTISLQRELMKLVPPVKGSDPNITGSISGNMWLPGNSLFMSEDAADLCSPQIYEDFFKPATQKVLNHFDSCFIHHHIIGKSVHPHIASLDGLSALQISQDPKIPSPIHILEELMEIHGTDLPMVVECEASEIEPYLPLLKKSRAILQIRIKNLQEGKDIMKLIRKNSRI